MNKQYEKDLNIYDVYESPNGNLFIKLSDNYSIGIGPKHDHEPNEEWGELKRTQYVKANNISRMKKVGQLVFDKITHKCICCKENATHIRHTQFAGSHPYCKNHAKLEKDYKQMTKLV